MLFTIFYRIRESDFLDSTTGSGIHTYLTAIQTPFVKLSVNDVHRRHEKVFLCVFQESFLLLVILLLVFKEIFCNISGGFSIIMLEILVIFGIFLSFFYLFTISISIIYDLNFFLFLRYLLQCSNITVYLRMRCKIMLCYLVIKILKCHTDIQFSNVSFLLF